MFKIHKSNLIFVFFAVFMSAILLYPTDAFAYNITCAYKDDKNEAYIIIDSDTGNNSGYVKSYNGKLISSIQNSVSLNETVNFEDIKKYALKGTSPRKKCPEYANVYERFRLWSGRSFANYFEVGGHKSEKTCLAAYKKQKVKYTGKNRDKNIPDGQYSIDYFTVKLSNYTDVNGNVLSASDSNFGSNTKSDSKSSELSCVDVLGDPVNDEKSVANFLQKIFNYIKILGPILVVVLSSVDFTKVILSGSEDEMKKAQKNLGIRMLCAAGLYFIPNLIILIFNIIFGGGFDFGSICGIK